MLFFLVSVLSFFFLLFCNSLPFQPLHSWASGGRLFSSLKHSHFVTIKTLTTFISMAAKKRVSGDRKIENSNSPILDLPELALERILGCLSPSELCAMAGVCKSLKERCGSDYLWERHMREKWGRVMGTAAERNWHRYLDVTNKAAAVGNVGVAKTTNLLIRWLAWLGSPSWMEKSGKLAGRLVENSMKSRYFALESGKIWFPAQIYNREHGHVGFMMSCYDAELSYDSSSDTFHVRYPPHGHRTNLIEEGVHWGRIRAPPVDANSHDLHISDCLRDLRPDDHIEIQWRRNKEFPYGWWYGIVGHLEPCDGNEFFCRCHASDTIILEFKQYDLGSRWRKAAINRRDHREVGNEADGFYGGIRKLYSKNEISAWRKLWPAHILE